MQQGKVYQLIVAFVSTISLAFAQTVVTLSDTLDASGGVSVDARGDIYVADFGTTLGGAEGTRVHKVFRDGSSLVFATGLEGASGNDFDSQGNLFQSNIRGNKLSKIDASGNVSDFVSANIRNPVGVTIGPNDTIYVANCRQIGSIAKVAPDGTSSIFVSSPLLFCPNGLTMDNHGNLYTCNFSNGNLIKITPDGNVSILATIPGGNNGHMTYANGRLYVVARCANQVYEVTLDGQISLLAGSGARGNDDGPALQATFSLPNGIAPSPDGDTLYINDDVNLTGTCQNTPLNPVLVRMIVDVTTSIEGPDEPASPIQKQFALYQNYPNPFNPSTQIQYFLPVASHVTITIYDVLGKRINALVNERQTAGTKTVEWSGRDESNALAPSGVYIYRLKAGSFVKSHKMLLIR